MVFFFCEATNLPNVSNQEMDQSQVQVLHLLQRQRRFHESHFNHQQRDQTRVIAGCSATWERTGIGEATSCVPSRPSRILWL